MAVPTTLLTGADVFDPQPRGLCDVLTVGGVVAAVCPADGARHHAASVLDAAVVDITGMALIPGLVDGHLHIVGGGGGAGFSSRIPELPVDAILEAGITTCVGMPGVDTVSKPPTGLLARARALSEQGVRCYTMAGGFTWPPPTATRSLREELYLLPEIIGIKIAVDEHLATAPSRDELARLLVELRWLRGTTGKACVLHVHLGTATPTSHLADAMRAADTPADMVQLTHANYSTSTLDTAVTMGRLGCWIDVNPLLNPDRVAGAIAPADTIAHLVGAGVPASQLTLSTDGNASVPRIRPDGTAEPFSFQLTLLSAVNTIVAGDVLPRDQALSLVTRNPATALRLAQVGRLTPGMAADLVAIDDNGAVRHVWSGGELRVWNGSARSRPAFRDPRWATR